MEMKAVGMRMGDAMQAVLILVQLMLPELGYAVPNTFGPTDFCHRETLNASCAENEVIMMKTARYGRMTIGKCVRKNLGYLGCAVDVIGFVDSRCSGRRSCTVKTADDFLYQTHPCPDDTTSYLQASYSCLPVSVDEKHECSKSGHITLPSANGYLASRMSEDFGYGSSLCPWILSVPQGQRVNFTLYNFARFGRPNPSSPSLLQSDPSVCYEIATIHDGSHRKNILTCGTDGRTKAVFLSRSNRLEVRFVDGTILRSIGQFLLKYEAVGCADVRAPRHGYVRREGDTVVVRCNFTEETWYLTCEGTRWIGTVGNCTGSGWSAVELFGTGDEFPYGILLVVAIGVALGVFFGGLLLSIAIFYIKRKQRHEPAAQSPPEVGEVMVDVKDLSEEGGERPPQWRPPFTDPRYPGGHYHGSGGTLPREATLEKRPEQYSQAHVVNPSEKDYGTRNHIYESPQFS